MPVARRTKAPKLLAECFIEGRPSVPQAGMGRRSGRDIWSTHVIDGTMALEPITGRCELELEFVLPPDRDSFEQPWERTLESLLKWTLDALEGTILRTGPAAEGELVAVHARRREAKAGESTGARLVLRVAG
jgi:hypothetical protein